MKTYQKGLIAAGLLAATLGLGACAGDGYSSYSVGVSSYDARGGYGYSPRRDRDWDGVPNRFDRDRDGDGVPNRFDSRPNNPRWP